MTEQQLTRMKIVLREDEMPLFSDETIEAITDSAGSCEMALYELLLLKSENTGIQISGLTIEDTSAYFRRLAQTYRPHNSGTLGE